MRVAIVSPFDPFPGPKHQSARAHVGGVERVLAEVSRSLAKRGHDVTLVCSTAEKMSETKEGAVTVLRVPRRTTLFRSPVVDLAKHVPKDTDVVHVPATYPFTTGRVLKQASKRGVASVLDFHFEPSPPGVVGKMAAAAYRQVGPATYRQADAVVLRSFQYGRSAKSLEDVPESRWRIVPNGVDTTRFQPAGPIPAQRDYVLFVGRLVPYKGVDVLIRALARLHPHPPLVVAGDGPLRRSLQSLAKSLRVPVRFMGHVADNELPALYRGAKLTVLPSINNQEAFGMTLLESMACGTPVVGSDLPGVSEVARIGGLIARRGDPEDLSRQIRRAMQPARLPRGSGLSALVHQAYSWEAVTDRLERVYHEVVARRRRLEQGNTEVSKNAHPGGHPLLQA